MSDDHDPMGDRIDDGFDRLRIDADALDTMAPLRRLESRRTRLPWARIALGGGVVAAALVLIGVYAFDDEPQEVVTASPTLEDQLGLPVGWLQDTRWVMQGGFINETNVLVEGVSARSVGLPDADDVITIARTHALTFAGNRLTADGYCGGFTAEVVVSGDELVVSEADPTGPVCDGGGEVAPEIARFMTALRSTDTIRLNRADGSIQLLGPDSVFTFEGSQPRALSPSVLLLDDQPLTGTFWRLTDGSGPDGDIVVTDTSPATLEFGSESIHGMNGCNRYSGNIQIIGTDSVSISDVVQTLAGCDTAEAEARFLAALRNVDTIDVSRDQLTLTGSESTLVFIRSQPPIGDSGRLTEARVDGTSWILTDSWDPRTGDPAVPLIDGSPITLTFAGGRVTGVADCRYVATFVLDRVPVFQQLEVDETDCEPELELSRSRYLQLLGATEGARFEDRSLVLSSELGILTFTVAEAEALDGVADIRWDLTGYGVPGGDDALRSSTGDAWLQLGGDGTITGDTGCRRLDGEWITSDGTIVLTALAAIGDCPGDVVEQDTLVVSTLGDGFTFTTDGAKLQIVSTGGAVLTYVDWSAIDAPSTQTGFDALVGVDLTLVDWTLRQETSEGAGITLRLEPDGTFRADSECSVLEGFWAQSSTGLVTATRSAARPRACLGETWVGPPQDFAETLFTGASLSVNDDRLIVTTNSGAGATFGPVIPEPSVDLVALTGVRWELEAWDVQVDGSSTPADAPAWFEMRPPRDPEAPQPIGTVKGTIGCSTLVGGWTLVDNSIAFTGEFESEACPDDMTAQDLAVSIHLGSGVLPVLDGETMTLLSTRRDVQPVQFRRGDPIDVANAPLIGTTWHLIDLPPLQVPLPHRDGRSTITFDGDGFTLDTRCGTWVGRYTLNGQRFGATGLEPDPDTCRDGFIDRDLERLLTEADALVIEDGLLIIGAAEFEGVFEPISE